MLFREKVRVIISNLGNLVEVANACDRAYCEGTNNAFGSHVPFGAESPEKVAQNLAGLQAVLTAVSILVLLNGKGMSYNRALEIIAEDDFQLYEEGLMLRLANCAWGAGQPFRTDKGPLGRATRLNFFDDLPEEDVKKDRHQILTAARWLREKMEDLDG